MRRWLVAGLLLVAALWLLVLVTPQKEQAPQGSATPEQASPLTAATPEPRPAQPTAATPVRSAPDPEEPDPEPTLDDEAPAPPSPTIRLPKLPPPEAQGPVPALKARFGNESAASSSQADEQQLMASLQRTGPPPELVEDVLCRRSVCRVGMRWTTQRVIPFYQALGALKREHDVGVDAAGPPDANQVHRVELYVDLTSRQPHP